MKTYSFAIACRPADEGRDRDEIVDALYEAGCDDALVMERAGAFVLEFDRESPTFAKALFSALQSVCQAGLLPLRIEPDPLVSAAEIAERTGLSRQAVTNYVKGQRGKGFPVPVARFDTASPLWRWLEVARWLQSAGKPKVDREATLFARWIDVANTVVVPGMIERAKRGHLHAH